MKILTAEEISTLSIKVTEPIEKRYFLSSLRTAIKNETVSSTKNCHFQFYYNEKTLTYELIFYEKTSDDIVLEPALIIANKFFENDDKKIKVLVTDGYLVVTQNHEILILKEITVTEDEEIILYVQQIYKIDDFELIRVSDEEISSLDSSINIRHTSKTYRLDESKAFKVFIILCASGFILLAMSIYLTYYTDEKSVQLPIKQEIASQTTDKKMIIDDTLKLFENISSYKIKLEKIDYRNHTITTMLSHSKKATLLEFANLYKQRLKIKSIKFDETTTLYLAEVTIEY